MRKLLLGAAAAFIAAPVMAATTVEFKRDTGETVVITLSEGTATLPDGSATSYTYDAETLTICFKQGEGAEDKCAKFAEQKPDDAGVGYSVRYTAADGAVGTATITAISE